VEHGRSSYEREGPALARDFLKGEEELSRARGEGKLLLGLFSLERACAGALISL
jgi:hypothetical protein